jgi:hypothetical protein
LSRERIRARPIQLSEGLHHDLNEWWRLYEGKEKEMTKKQKMLKKAEKLISRRHNIGSSYYLDKISKYAPFITFVCVAIIFYNTFISLVILYIRIY